jgi:hypothetical protein
VRSNTPSSRTWEKTGLVIFIYSLLLANGGLRPSLAMGMLNQVLSALAA